MTVPTSRPSCPGAAESYSWLRSFAVGLSVFVATAALLTGGFILLRHPGSAGPPSKPTPAAVTAPTPTTMPTPTPPAAMPIPSYLPASGPVCMPSQLEMRLGEFWGTGGSGITYLIFTDRGAAPCTLRGTPAVTLLGTDGRPLAVPAIVKAASGMIPTHPNDGVGLIPLAEQGTAPGPDPEGGVRGQASLPLQYSDSCANSVTAVAVDFGSARLTVPLTLGVPEGAPHDCELTSVVVNPFQPAEFMP